MTLHIREYTNNEHMQQDIPPLADAGIHRKNIYLIGHESFFILPLIQDERKM